MKLSYRLICAFGLSLIAHGVLFSLWWPRHQPSPPRQPPLQLQLVAPASTTQTTRQNTAANHQSKTRASRAVPLVKKITVPVPTSITKPTITVAPTPSATPAPITNRDVAASTPSTHLSLDDHRDATSAMTPARYLGNIQSPPYPETARARGEEGVVEVRVTVAADGRVQQIVLLRSSGFDELDQAALDLLRQGKYTPAQRAGEPVASRLRMVVPFRLAY